jgi:hypothetical protein
MTQRTYPDHPFIKKARDICDIPDEDFLAGFLQKFVVLGPDDRKRDLLKFDEAQKFDRDLREETQLASVRRRLRAVDEKMRKAGL